jgi:hypothetical protein
MQTLTDRETAEVGAEGWTDYRTMVLVLSIFSRQAGFLVRLYAGLLLMRER